VDTAVHLHPAEMVALEAVVVPVTQVELAFLVKAIMVVRKFQVTVAVVVVAKVPLVAVRVAA